MPNRGKLKQITQKRSDCISPVVFNAFKDGGSRVFCLSPSALEKLPEITGSFQLKRCRVEPAAYFHLGRQDDIEMAPGHFLDGFYMETDDNRVTLTFTSICPAVEYGDPLNVAAFPDVMLSAPLEFYRSENLATAISYLFQENPPGPEHQAIPAALQWRMIRLALSAIMYVAESGDPWQPRFPGLPQMSEEEEETLADKGYFMAAEYA